MKAILLFGGTGSRLMPLTKSVNKQLLPIGLKPMSYWVVEKVLETGIKDILIVTGTEHAGSICDTFGSGEEFGCNFTYRIQERPGGIAQAIGLGREFSKDEPYMVILGDNIFEYNLKDDVEKFSSEFIERRGGGEHISKISMAKIFLMEVEDPERYGVAEIENGKVINIEEKPKNPKTNLASVGIYFYSPNSFNRIKTLKPSKRGEIEVTDLNNSYVKEGKMKYSIINGFYSDAGTLESYKKVNQWAFDNLK